MVHYRNFKKKKLYPYLACCKFDYQQRALKTFSEIGYHGSKDGGSLVMEFTGKFLYIAQHFILLRLIPLILVYISICITIFHRRVLNSLI